MEQMECVHQFPPAQFMQQQGCPLRGRWNAEAFHRQAPLVLELGCGKGEYAVGLAQEQPQCNYIGVDIKGARLWTGAKQVTNLGLANCRFLRTEIGLIDHFFGPSEVSEIWITFPDPQMKKVSKRLTGTRFLTLYSHFLKPGALIRLKTDSPFLFLYTSAMLRVNNITPLVATDNLYASNYRAQVPEIKTFYERQWLSRGMTIKYIVFTLPEAGTPLQEPDDDIPYDDYRSLTRGAVE